MKEQLKTIKIIHLALCAGVIVAYFVLSNIASFSELLSVPNIETTDYIYFLIPVIAYLASNFMYKNQLKNANKNSSDTFNFTVFQTASIVRWAILEGSAFMILILKPEFILFGILIIIYLFLLRPTEDRFRNDLNLL